MERMVNITSLFTNYVKKGHDEVSISINEYTYAPNIDLENDWLSFAFCSFKTLKNMANTNLESALVIGSGNGTDAVAISKIFKPNKLCVTDVMSNTLPIIEKNIKRIVPNQNFELIQSDLFEKVDRQKFKLIYENLPNIPCKLLNKDLESGINSSSYISDKYINNGIYSKYLLDLHHTFLKECKEYLDDNGYAICNIGIRFPVDIYDKLFTELDYKYQILVMGIKEQTEATDVLSGYLEASNEYDVEMYYYRLDMLESSQLEKIILPSNEERNNFLNKIKKAKISISEAVKLYNQGVRVGHLVFTTCVQK